MYKERGGGRGKKNTHNWVTSDRTAKRDRNDGPRNAILQPTASFQDRFDRITRKGNVRKTVPKHRKELNDHAHQHGENISNLDGHEEGHTHSNEVNGSGDPPLLFEHGLELLYRPP